MQDPKDLFVDDGTELPMPQANDGTAAIGDMGTTAAAFDTSAVDSMVTLSLSELLPDANREIVIVSEGDDSKLQILTDLQLTESGVAESHLTESGLQVAGFNYWVFEDGTKLYYAPGTAIELDHPA